MTNRTLAEVQPPDAIERAFGSYVKFGSSERSVSR